ncbi:MAG: 4,5-DOPA dioxygenase extradiol [Parcubacteria group bacterium]|nr:4,5-DOPA dioxygenase extradiol [Parcubacteria group bacterium]
MALHTLKTFADNSPATEKMPVLFIGHGSPMNAIEDTVWSEAWKTIGESMPHPRAILSVSAHWLSEGTRVHAAEKPKTIHDFWGFPKALYDMTYPCPGSPSDAKETARIITNTKVAEDLDWGVDHGTWIVLARIFPKADIPVFQLSIDISKPSAFHYELGKELRMLREKGILIMGSGNIVHNLGVISFEPNAKPFDWAVEFDDVSKKLLETGDDLSLIHYEKLGKSAELSIPTPDHFWPLLYTLGARNENEKPEFLTNGIAHGSVSMRTLRWG